MREPTTCRECYHETDSPLYTRRGALCPRCLDDLYEPTLRAASIREAIGRQARPPSYPIVVLDEEGWTACTADPGQIPIFVEWADRNGGEVVYVPELDS